MKNYDVFISCKSEDYNLARQVHDFLSRNGYNVFLADAELQIVGRAEYGEVIDEALESAEHLVLLASKPEYVKSTYVKNEWRIFLEEQRCGRKTGNLLTICNGFDCAKLPISLRNLQTFTYDNYQASIINYLPIGSPKGQKAKHTVAEQAKPTKQAPTNEIQRLFLAAEQGDADAQYELGRSFFAGIDFDTGRDFIQDYEQAAKWFHKAAEQGNDEAQVQLGICYANGLGVDQNDNLARFWWKKAADQGNETAYSFLPELKYTTSEDVAYQLILNRVDGHKLPVAKVLHDIMEIGISEAKRMVDDAPTILLESSSKYEAIQLKRKLELSLGTSYQSLLEIQETSNYPTNSYEVFVTDKSSVPTVILTKYIWDRGNLSVKQAKDLVDSLPGPVFIRCNYNLAESIAQEIRELGAIVEVRRSRT